MAVPPAVCVYRGSPGEGLPNQEQTEVGLKPDGLVMSTPQVKAAWVDLGWGQHPLSEVYPEPWR